MLTEQPHTHYLIDPPRRFQQPDPDPLDVTPRLPDEPGRPSFGQQWAANPHPLPRFREQRRRSRWGCSVALLAIVAALVVAWALVILVLATFVSAVTAAPSAAPDRSTEPFPAGGHRVTVQGQRSVPSALGGASESPRQGHAALRGTGAAVAPAGTLPVSVPAKTSGVASWYEARGYQGAVPWWRPGQDPVWAAVSRFADGRTYAVTVLVTGFCQCLVGQPGERAIDLSLPAFRELADPSVGLIRVTVEVPVRGPKLPATDTR